MAASAGVMCVDLSHRRARFHPEKMLVRSGLLSWFLMAQRRSYLSSFSPPPNHSPSISQTRMHVGWSDQMAHNLKGAFMKL